MAIGEVSKRPASGGSPCLPTWLMMERFLQVDSMVGVRELDLALLF